MLAIVFWIAIALLLWVYVGYPLAAAVAGRVRPFQIRAESGRPAAAVVTVGIAAHNEADQLAARIANVLEQDVPFELEVIVASDGSTDGSVELVERLAAADARIRSLDLARGGQTAAQRAIFAAARGEVVVLTDAETRFAPGCLAALVEPLADARVGAVTGRLAWLNEDRTETSRNEGAYWRYEQLVRRLESRAGWLTAVTGALLAIRASAYRDVPDYASMDHLLPLAVRDQGLVVLAVPRAVASDRTVGGPREQFRNRSRTATRGILANLSMAGRLAPWRRPSAFLAIWSHKLLRWATPLLAGTAGVSAIALGAAGDTGYLVVVAFGLALLVLAGSGWLLRSVGRPVVIGSLPLAIVVVNLAFLSGWWNLLRGRRIETWQGADWTAATAGIGGRDGDHGRVIERPVVDDDHHDVEPGRPDRESVAEHVEVLGVIENRQAHRDAGMQRAIRHDEGHARQGPDEAIETAGNVADAGAGSELEQHRDDDDQRGDDTGDRIAGDAERVPHLKTDLGLDADRAERDSGEEGERHRPLGSATVSQPDDAARHDQRREDRATGPELGNYRGRARWTGAAGRVPERSPRPRHTTPYWPAVGRWYAWVTISVAPAYVTES